MRRSVVPFTLPLAVLLVGAVPAGKPVYGDWGVDYASMDRAVRPGNDFFGYAEGTWLRTAPIPADKARAGYNYDLPDEAERQVRAIVDEAGAHPTTPLARQIADYYAAWMDAAGIDARGLAPARPFLQRIAEVHTSAELAALTLEPGYAGPIDLYLGADAKAPTRYTVMAEQAELGLPTRDYYLLDGAKYATLRRAYRDYLVRLQVLAGMDDAEASADRMLALETALARDQWTPERRRDPVATYNPMSRAALAAAAPQFDWPRALAAQGLAAMPTVVVGEPDVLAKAGRMLDSVPLDTWKRWIAVRFLSDHAQFLPKPFDDAHFAFYGRTLHDVPEQRERWKRGMALLDRDLGEAVGQLYVQRHWSDQTQGQVDELVRDLRTAYAAKIAAAGWMDTPTRTAALAKLATFDPRVGHPVRYINYAGMAVSRTDPLANGVEAERFRWRLALSRLGKPVDRTLWDMTPQTVNAYYNPVMNQVTFPAAQLQPPFFDAHADPAVNYGETGATIGHEIGHGFDDEGRQFHAAGRLRDWWTPATATRYTAHAQRLVKQFNGYEPLPGTHIKGQLTLGENLADLGGLEVAYAAYRLYVGRHGEPRVIDGFTGDQRFFIAYAQSWQGKAREGSLRDQLLSNPHSPDQYRVNGIVRNMDDWYRAFGVVRGDALYLAPAERVRVW